MSGSGELSSLTMAERRPAREFVCCSDVEAAVNSEVSEMALILNRGGLAEFGRGNGAVHKKY